MRDRLLVRPTIHSGEWWEGYIFRTLLANGVSTSGYSRLVDTPLMTEEMARIPHLAGRYAGVGIVVGGHQVPKWAVLGNAMPNPVCAECWREAQYVRLAWRLQSAPYCDRHSCALMVECSKCLQPISMHAAFSQRCSCGTNLLGIEPATSDAASAARIDDEVDQYSALELAAHLLLLRVQRSSQGSHHGRMKRRLDAPSSLLLKHTARSNAWQSALESHLFALQDPHEMMVTLENLLWVYDHEQFNRTVLSELPLWQFAANLVDRGAYPFRAIHLQHVDRFAIAQKTSGNRSALSGGLFRLASIRPGSFRLGDFISLEETSVEVSLRPEAEWKAYRAELFEGIIPGAPILMRKTERDLLIKDLSQVALPNDARPDRTFSLGARDVWINARPKCVVAALERLRAGSLRVWLDTQGEGFDRFLVGVDTIKEFGGRRLRGPKYCDTQISLQI